MWSPTHVQVLVKKAKGLNIKGKNGTNDSFVTIALGKEKFQTSVKEKATESVEWCEQCELSIPTQGNTAEIQLSVLHRNFMGVDEFLGQISLPLKDFDVYERPKTKWYNLKCKPGQTKDKYRGELEVRVGFTVKASSTAGGSMSDLTKKTKGSLQSLNKVANNLGGSLLSIGTKEKKNIKKFAKSMSHKVEKVGEKAKKSVSSLKQVKESEPLEVLPESRQWNTLDTRSSNRGLGFRDDGNYDPGVNSDDEDDMFKFEELSHKSSGSSLQVGNMGIVSNTSTPLNGSLENLGGGEFLRRSITTPTGGSIRGTPAGSVRGISKPPRTPSMRSNLVLDEWEAKLLGKKGQFTGSQAGDDAVSISSLASGTSRGTSGTVADTWQPGTRHTSVSTAETRGIAEGGSRTASSSSNPGDAWNNRNITKNSDSGLPSYKQATESSRTFEPEKQVEAPVGRKKIIPVQSDFESSPSPESPSSPIDSPLPGRYNANKFTKSHSQGQFKYPKENDELEQKRKSIGMKLKSTYSSFSLFDISKVGRGFRDKDDSKSSRRNSVESNISRHSRTHSDGSEGPPAGTRVVLGRETTPIPLSNNSRISHEIMTRFDGKSREDLIEMIVNLQGTVEHQGRKADDLEDYIDSLLIRVMDVNPMILQKDLPCFYKAPLK